MPVLAAGALLTLAGHAAPGVAGVALTTALRTSNEYALVLSPAPMAPAWTRSAGWANEPVLLTMTFHVPEMSADSGTDVALNMKVALPPGAISPAGPDGLVKMQLLALLAAVQPAGAPAQAVTVQAENGRAILTAPILVG